MHYTVVATDRGRYLEPPPPTSPLPNRDSRKIVMQLREKKHGVSIHTYEPFRSATEIPLTNSRLKPSFIIDQSMLQLEEKFVIKGGKKKKKRRETRNIPYYGSSSFNISTLRRKNHVTSCSS